MLPRKFAPLYRELRKTGPLGGWAPGPDLPESPFLLDITFNAVAMLQKGWKQCQNLLANFTSK